MRNPGTLDVGQALVLASRLRLSLPASIFQVYSLVVAVKLQRRRTLLLRSEARLFRSAEWQLILHPRAGQIHREQARLHAVNIIEHTREVRGLDRRRQTERNIIGDSHRIAKILGAHYGQYGPKNFLLRDAHVLADFAKNRGLDKVAFTKPIAVQPI